MAKFHLIRFQKDENEKYQALLELCETDADACMEAAKIVHRIESTKYGWKALVSYAAFNLKHVSALIALVNYYRSIGNNDDELKCLKKIKTCYEDKYPYVNVQLAQYYSRKDMNDEASKAWRDCDPLFGPEKDQYIDKHVKELKEIYSSEKSTSKKDT